MGLQEEMNEMRAYIQALIDYIGRPQIAAQFQANQEAAKAQTEGAAVAAVTDQAEPAKDPSP